MRELVGHTSFVQGLAFSPDGASLASAGTDGTARLWDLRSGKARLTLRGHTGPVTTVALSPDGKVLASGGRDGKVHLWSTDNGESLEAPGRWREQVVSLTFSPDGKALAWGTYNGNVEVWKVGAADSPPDINRAGKMIYTVRFSPQGGRLASGGPGKGVLLWDVRKASARPAGELEHGDELGCRGLAWHPSGRLLVLALAGGVELWDPDEKRLVARLTEHTDVVSGVAFNGDGSLLLTASWDHTIRLYAIDPRGSTLASPRACFDWGLGKVFDLAFAPDGMTAAAAGDRGPRLVVWDIE